MSEGKAVTGFIGAGGIARAHAFALESMSFYYNDAPEIIKESVCSASRKSRDSFAGRFGFISSCDPGEFFRNDKIDTVFILGPNNVHYEHFRRALVMPSIRRIYIEKPVCSTPAEETLIRKLAEKNDRIKIQVGFQYLFSPAIREALSFWRSGIFGKPLHFELKYHHGDYLKEDYRSKRLSRLTPSPDGGALADLGSHIISLLTAFLNDKLEIVNAVQSGSFEDVTESSDLFSLITLLDPVTGAAGSLSSSRISSGSGDLISLELCAEKGTLKYSTISPDGFDYFLEDTGLWHRQVTGSRYDKISNFPSGHVSPGWLRSMVHAHYVFFTGNDSGCFVPGLDHGLAVQRLIRQGAENLAVFRKSYKAH